MTKRERFIAAARLRRRMPGGISGELYEREQVLEMLGVTRIYAPKAVFRRAVEGHSYNLRELKERSAKRAAIFGWKLVGNPPRWDWPESETGK